MTEFEKAFIEALEEGHAYDFIANHYTQLSKESLKDIILECLYEIEQSAGCDRYADTDNIVEELNDRWDYEDVDDDYSSNAPCDTYGMCSGSNCKRFHECN